jgi:membrane-associated HD superfamily phosphohydrolase
MLLDFVNGKSPSEDKHITAQIEKLKEDISNDFISDYETAAQDVIEYCIQSRHTDISNKLRMLLLDLLVSGTAFYKVRPSSEETNVVIEVFNPMNVFVDKNPSSQYVKDAYRVVVRKWMTKQQILNEYGDELDRDSIAELGDLFEHYTDYGHVYIRSIEGVPTSRPYSGDASGLRAGDVAVPGFPVENKDTLAYKLIPVYEVEWVDVDKENGTYV